MGYRVPVVANKKQLHKPKPPNGSVHSDKAWAKAKTLHAQGKTFAHITKVTKIPDRTLKYRSKRDSWVKGSLAQTMHEAKVQGFVSEAHSAGITEARVLKELEGIAFLDIKDIVDHIDDTGTVTFKPLNEMDGRVIAAIREKRGKDGESFVDIEPHAKMKALELLGRNMGMWKDRVDLTSNGRSILQEIWEDDE